MRTCRHCKGWQIIETTNSARGDAQMVKMDYKNCLKDTSKLRHARFIHADAKACKEFNK